MAQQFALHDDTPAYNPRYGRRLRGVRGDRAVAGGRRVVPGAARHGSVGGDGGGARHIYDPPLRASAGAALVGGPAGQPSASTPTYGCAPRSKSPHGADEGEAAADAPPSTDDRSRAGPRLLVPSATIPPGHARAGAHGRPLQLQAAQEPSLPTGPGLARLADGDRWASDARQPAGAEPQVNVEQVLKKLADALNATPSNQRAEKPAATNETEAMIGQSVAALQATARTMARPQASFEPAPGQVNEPRAACHRGGRHPGPPTPAIPARASRARPPPSTRGSRRLPRRSWRSAWRCCSSRSTPWPKPRAPFRGQHAAAHGRRHRAGAERVLARGARLRVDAAHRCGPHGPRRPRRPQARRAGPAGLGAGGRGRRVP